MRWLYMRALFAFAMLVVVGAGLRPAFADTELVVLPPVGNDGGEINAALQKSHVGTLSTRTIDVACATDPGCLAKTGSELGARRTLAISFAGGGKLTLMLVDVGAKLLLGT